MNVDFVVGAVLGWLMCMLVVITIAFLYVDRWERRLKAECDRVLKDIRKHGCIGYDREGRDK